MKKRKLLFLLIAVLCLSLVFTACGEDKDPDPQPTPDEGTGGTGNEGTGTGDNNEEEQVKTPEFLDWFIVDGDYTAPTLTKIEALDGTWMSATIINDDGDYCYAVMTEEIDALLNCNVTITFYKNGEKLENATYKSTYYTVDYDGWYGVSLYGDLYLVSEHLSTTSRAPESYENKINYTIRTYNSGSYTTFNQDYDEDFYLSSVGDGYRLLCEENAIWYTKDLNTIYTTTRDIYDTYYGIDREFDTVRGGYAYFLNYNSVDVFKGGTCVASYSPATINESVYYSCVLNNGNVLIQTTERLAFGAEDFDLIDGGYPYKVRTYTMTPAGKLTELEDVNFYVVKLDSAEDGAWYFPFELKKGENQALISYFSLSGWSLDPQWVVLDNDLNVEYTVDLPVNTDFHDIDSAYAIGDELIALPLITGGTTQFYVFDLEFNKLGALPDYDYGFIYDDYVEYVSSKYVITEAAVYTLKGELVYSFENNDVHLSCLVGDKILVSLDANQDDAPEYAFLDPETGKLDVIADSLSAELVDADAGYYVVRTYCPECLAGYKEEGSDHDDHDDCENCEYTLYNANGDVLLKACEDIDVDLYDDWFHSFAVVSAYFEGEWTYYLVR